MIERAQQRRVPVGLRVRIVLTVLLVLHTAACAAPRLPEVTPLPGGTRSVLSALQDSLRSSDDGSALARAVMRSPAGEMDLTIALHWGAEQTRVAGLGDLGGRVFEAVMCGPDVLVETVSRAFDEVLLTEALVPALVFAWRDPIEAELTPGTLPDGSSALAGQWHGWDVVLSPVTLSGADGHPVADVGGSTAGEVVSRRWLGREGRLVAEIHVRRTGLGGVSVTLPAYDLSLRLVELSDP